MRVVRYSYIKKSGKILFSKVYTMSSLGYAGFYGAFTLLALFVQQYTELDRARDYDSTRRGNGDQIYFDFVIVGSGSAGSVLANRLSRKFRVLVLEAGGKPNPLLGIPAMGFPMELNPEMDWRYETVPQRNACLGLMGQRSFWPRGKALGGSSNLNAMIYLRGHPQDFDSMATRLQDPIWKYKNVQEVYKSFENFNDDSPNHGHGGEQPVEHNSDTYELTDAFVKAGREYGYPTVDLNTYHVQGFSPLTYSTRKGVRWEDYLAFLRPAMESPSNRLTVYKYSKVTRILIDQNKRAYGVEYERHGGRLRAYASKEILISAGAINSPQLLILSGIGPRNQLQNLGIPIVIDLPVGKNLQDHVGTSLGMFSIDPPFTNKISTDASLYTFLEYLTYGTGPLSTSFVKAVGSVPSKFARAQAPLWPDIQLTLIGASHPKEFESILPFWNIHPGTVYNLWKKTADANTFQIFVLNSRPRQRGEVTLVSASPHLPPRIDPMYLQNPDDVQVLVEGLKLTVNLVTDSAAFKKLGGKLIPIPLDSCAEYKIGTDAYFECYVRQLTLTLYHPCCTCPMGNSSDTGRVTDSEFRVVGVSNLRVIDASSFPTIPSSNLNAPTNLVGEIGSRFVCQHWIGKKCK